MQRKIWLMGSALATIALFGNLYCANDETKDPQTGSESSTSKIASPKDITPFTGRISKNKVRMRVQPNLDAKILKELSKDELIVVIGETEDFYAIQPPQDTKGYIFRTFVLDNVIEGNRVNVRLEPELESPIIAQLSTGDRVDGTISPLNSKWIEITPPSSVRFYIAKEYVEKIGDSNMMARIQQRRTEVNSLLSTAYSMSQAELQKPFPEMNLNSAISTYNKVIHQFGDFPEQVARAKELLSSLQEKYLQSKIAYLESRAQILDEIVQKGGPENQPSSQEVIPAPAAAPVEHYFTNAETTPPRTPMAKSSPWNGVEEKLLTQWLAENPERTSDEYYEDQHSKTITLKGVVEYYNRNIKNKPGDYLLINTSTNLPTAYLYSTQVNLQDLVGHDVTLKAVPRPNNNFAFPAYLIISHD